jgi:hypothetical protein
MILLNTGNLELLKIIKELEFDSYFIDWVKPIEARLFAQYGELRISLQKFYPCDPKETYYHNHPWYKEMLITKGTAMQGISTSFNPSDYNKELDINENSMELVKNEFSEMILTEGSIFSIKTPETFHYLYPLNNRPLYSIMINKAPWFKGPKSPNGEIKHISDSDRKEIMEACTTFLRMNK